MLGTGQILSIISSGPTGTAVLACAACAARVKWGWHSVNWDAQNVWDTGGEELPACEGMLRSSATLLRVEQ